MTASVFLSSLLLALSFPKFNLGWCAWFALVPVFSAISKSKSYGQSFLIFFLCGYIFYFISIEWLRHVAFIGPFFISGILGLYFGLFGIAAHYFLSEERIQFGFLSLPAVWVLLEFVRTEIPVWSFGWNLLAYSQSPYLPIARLASYLGAYGVSFLIVFVNMTLWFLIKSFHAKEKRLRALRKFIYATLCLLIVFFHFGRFGESTTNSSTPTIAVSVIQGNIPQSEKWNPEVKSAIIEKYKNLSEFAASNQPQLIIWPEAAWPGVFNRDPEGEQIKKMIRDLEIPFLIGSPYEEYFEGNFFSRIYNSTFLIDQKGEILERYDKIRLVPFGEFVPAASFFALFGLEKYAYSLGVGDFSAGKKFTVFESRDPSQSLAAQDDIFRFSSLICFEDTFPSLARQFVKRGAQFLVVVTNDAWFGESAAPYQHLQASIFRAIENGVPVIRAANTGVSAFISDTGIVLDRVKDSKGHDTWIAGGLTYPVLIKNSTTFYQKAGYFFPLFCLLLGFGLFVLSRFARFN